MAGQLYLGGDIHTVDEARPSADAVAVEGGKIVEVGSEHECRAALARDFETVDLEGGVLFPGFIDTHVHPVMMIYFDMNVDLRDVTSIEELQDKLRDASKNTPPDNWVVALNFDEENVADSRFPTRHDLDRACKDLPAVVIKHDGHTVIGNTLAIEAVGISADSIDPEGGVIDREPDGQPAGPFREEAAVILKDAIPLPHMPTFIESAGQTFDRLLAHGITSIGIILQTGEEGIVGASGQYDVMLMQIFQENLPVNLYSLLIAGDAEEISAVMQPPLHDHVESGADRTIGAMKIFSDGTLGSHTAYMRSPFSDEPGNTGLLTHEPEEIYRRMVSAHRAGLQIAIHAIGDAANRMVVDLYDRLLNEFPREDHRHRIEHAVVLDQELISDIARLGLVVSTSPLYIPSEKHWLHKRLGPERVKLTYPNRALLDAGVRLAGSSDAPIESIDVLHAIHCCVTRDGFEPEQGIAVDEAIRMFTIDAAYSQFEDSIKGSISVGKRADMVILSANPASVSTEDIRKITVEQTFVGGNSVYRREG